MKRPAIALSAIAFAWAMSSSGADPKTDPQRPSVDANGTVHIPAFSIPLSRYMSEEAKRQFIEEARRQAEQSDDGTPTITKWRADEDAYYGPVVARARAQYPVTIEDRTLAGVRTQIVTPKEGVSANNRNRVLINLHGGSFLTGAGLGGLAESVPIAGVGKYKVVSVDYRMAPEHRFPAASEDVAAVYSELLKQYGATNVGIYGCSAGGILTAMATAWFQKEKLPAPGAIGIFGAGAYGSFSGPAADPNTWGGDSSFIAPAVQGQQPPDVDGPSAWVHGAMDYTGNTNKEDPLASPALSPAILAKFPPTLLLTGTRAWDMSAAAQTQRALTNVGVEADLHLWDGMGHCFLVDSGMPESREAYAVIARFFDRHLGRE